MFFSPIFSLSFDSSSFRCLMIILEAEHKRVKNETLAHSILYLESIGVLLWCSPSDFLVCVLRLYQLEAPPALVGFFIACCD